MNCLQRIFELEGRVTTLSNQLARAQAEIRVLRGQTGRSAVGLIAAIIFGGSIAAMAAVPFQPYLESIAGNRWPDRAAQLRAESGFNPRAVSPVGARGLAQFMPKTWTWAQGLGWVSATDSPEDPEAAIRANHAYMMWLEVRCAGRWDRALGSYNAGLLSVQRALRHAEATGLSGSDSWLRALPAITGHHAAETQGYVARCARYRDEYRKVAQ